MISYVGFVERQTFNPPSSTDLEDALYGLNASLPCSGSHNDKSNVQWQHVGVLSIFSDIKAKGMFESRPSGTSLPPDKMSPLLVSSP